MMSRSLYRVRISFGLLNFLLVLELGNQLGRGLSDIVTGGD